MKSTNGSSNSRDTIVVAGRVKRRTVASAGLQEQNIDKPNSDDGGSRPISHAADVTSFNTADVTASIYRPSNKSNSDEERTSGFSHGCENPSSGSFTTTAMGQERLSRKPTYIDTGIPPSRLFSEHKHCRYAATKAAAGLKADPLYKSHIHSSAAVLPQRTREGGNQQKNPSITISGKNIKHSKAIAESDSVTRDLPNFKDQVRHISRRSPKDPPASENHEGRTTDTKSDLEAQISLTVKSEFSSPSQQIAAGENFPDVSSGQSLIEDSQATNNCLVCATPVMEQHTSRKANDNIVLATPIQKIRWKRWIISLTIICLVVAIAISSSVSVVLKRRSDNVLQVQNETEPERVPNESFEDDGSESESQVPELTLKPSSEPSTELPKEWIQLGQDTDIEGSEDVTATAVAISRNGLVFALGASQPNRDQVLVYKYENAYWKLQAEIYGFDDYGATGRALALDASGSILAVGSPWDEYSEPSESTAMPFQTKSTGLVRVYQIEAGAANIYQAAIPLGSDIKATEIHAEFGWSVDLSSNGSIVAIGARKQCIVRVLQFDVVAQEWFQLGANIDCVADDGESYDDTFGTSVSLSGDGYVLAVGEPGRYAIDDTDSVLLLGRVRVYRFNETAYEWQGMGQTINGEALDDAFGISLSLSMNATTLAVGSPFSGSNNQNNRIGTGSCRVFRYNSSNDSWVQLGQDIDGEATGDYFGQAVALSADGNVVAVGATGSNAKGDDSGHVRVLEYDWTASTWSQVGKDIAGPFGKSEAGMSVALSDSGSIVTIPSSSSRLPDSAGMARAQVYESGVVPKAGNFEVMVAVHSRGDDFSSYEIRWFTEKLDEEKLTVVATGMLEEGTGHANGTMMLVKGGVYRFVLTVINSGTKALASFEIFHHDDQGEVFVFGQKGNITYAESTFIASVPDGEHAADLPMNITPAFVTLHIDFNEYPSEVHWVLLSKTFVAFDNQMKIQREVLAFGPETRYGNKLAGSTYKQIIDVSIALPGSTFLFYFTDTGRDGICCSSGAGSYTIYNGTTDGNVLTSGSAEGLYREMKEFSIY